MTVAALIHAVAYVMIDDSKPLQMGAWRTVAEANLRTLRIIKRHNRTVLDLCGSGSKECRNENNHQHLGVFSVLPHDALQSPRTIQQPLCE